MIIYATIVLGVLVFIHEGGHFLAARAFGVRVTEFMLGLPGPSIGFQRGETRFGVTAVPLGGYARVCGMEPGEMSPHLRACMASVYERGEALMEEVAQDCGITDDEAYEALEELVEWGTIAGPGKKDQYNTYRTPRVEPTRRQLARAQRAGLPAIQSFEQGTPRPLDDVEAFFQQEYRQQYRSLPTWKRIVILLAGPGVNLLFGQNGSGKTNLLEAVHYCALGRSHRTAQDMEVVRKGAEAAACGVTVKTAGGTREIALRLTPDEGKHKQVFVDRKRAARLASLMGQVQCVMFSPEDLQLIKEGPSERRAFLDMMLSQLSPSYFVALQQYRKALDQRNAILRDCRKFGRPLPAMTEDFERQMARAASAILPTRRKAAERLERIAAEKYAAISGKTAEALGLPVVLIERPPMESDNVAGSFEEVLSFLKGRL